MIRWASFDPPDTLATPGPKHKPWRVTRYRTHWYWGYRVGPIYSAHFRWYWQANIVSFLWHHLGGWYCNTWRRVADAPPTEPGGEPIPREKLIAQKNA